MNPLVFSLFPIVLFNKYIKPRIIKNKIINIYNEKH